MNVNEETAALIAEARRWANGHPNRRSGELMRDLADALEALAAPQEAKWEHGVIGGDDLLARLMDTLAYYHCRSVNPKADSPYMGYHAMSEDQREFLREKQRDAAEEVLRMWQAESRPPTLQEGDARERLHAKCDCVPDLGPAHCHLCTGEGSPVRWDDCEAVREIADVSEPVEVVLTTTDIEGLAHLLVQLSPATQKNSGATIRRLLREINIKEVGQ